MLKSYKSIIATIILLVVLCAGFTILLRSYEEAEREQCFDEMKEYTNVMSDTIKNRFDSDRECLRVIADLIENCDISDIDTISSILSFRQNIGIISSLEVLFQDNMLLAGNGQYIDVSDRLDFEDEAKKSEHISGREFDLFDEEVMVVRSYVPIEINGEIKALLCGVIRLDTLSKQSFNINSEGYGEFGEFYILDTKSGDFIFDTWHKSLMNSGGMTDRKGKASYSLSNFSRNDLMDKSGEIIYNSTKANEYFYCYYTPIAINKWSLLISMPESIVLNRVHKMMAFFGKTVVFILCVFAFYFIWLIASVKKEAVEKERQIEKISYMFDVEKVLFDVHIKPENIYKALAKVGKITTAQKTFLFVFNKSLIKSEYVWEESGESVDLKFIGEKIENCFPEIYRVLKNGESYILSDILKLSSRYEKEASLFRKMGIKNIMVAPIVDLNGELLGAIGASNMKNKITDAGLVTCVSLSFSTAINNFAIYNKIKKMGLIDDLTGLLNRNSFNQKLDILKNPDESIKSLACVYIDANGLHEVNNHLGHKEGDRMLKVIAGALKNEFGRDCTYRIGGDEFVVICVNEHEEDVVRKAENAKRFIDSNGYHISAGIKWCDKDFCINNILNASEEIMQNAKREYYKEKGDLRKIREMDKQLEQMITDKRDADIFLSVIAPNFKGVYFVNMNRDSVRNMFIPPYFEDMLSRTNDKFSNAMRIYAEELVCIEERDAFNAFCDYGTVEKGLDDGAIPKLIYKKLDGEFLKLSIMKSIEYTEDNKETLWIFEKISEEKTFDEI